jgi:hypothetical protein
VREEEAGPKSRLEAEGGAMIASRGYGRIVRALAIAMVSALTLAAGAHASDPTKYGIETVSASLSTTQAGAHPDFTSVIELKTDPTEPTKNGLKPPYARTRNLFVTIPPGLLGNPNNFPQCTTQELEQEDCPQDSQIGITSVAVYLLDTFTEPVYLMEPQGAGVVARIGFIAGQYPTIMNLRVSPETGYAVEARLENASSVARLVRAETTLWGVPTDPVHDPLRITPQEAVSGNPPPGGGRASGLAPTPFMTNPTRCGVARELRVVTDSYQLPGKMMEASAPFPEITGCGKLNFSPTFALRPTTTAADSPSGIDATLELPQEGLNDLGVLATPHLKKAEVTLPKGMTLNPASARGLGACTEAQVGLVSEDPIRFNGAPAACPDSAKVGTAEFETPVLPGALHGSLYLASQGDNPFGSLLAGYLVAEGHGVALKLAGRFNVDPSSGQLTAVFDENPEQPFESLELHFKSGDQGVVTTPNACGAYSIQAILSPWSALDPFAPAPSEVVESSSPFSISTGPGGGPCPNGEASVDLDAGTVNPTAGSFSPFVLRLTRPDGTQRLTGLELTLPPGLTGKLAGVPYCSDVQLATAASLNRLGGGVLETGLPSCPAGSRLGSVTAGLGSGPSPFFVSAGAVYLAGPYKGAPLSFAVVAPAAAGPFDLGNVVVRTALHIDPSTAQITAISDPLPTMLEGIPLNLRDLRVNIDRQGFTLNPTSCQPKAFSGFAVSEGGERVPISERFQAASCASLEFKPKLSIRLKGGTKRTSHPALRAVLTARRGDANLARASVTLPPSQFIDQAHISNPCTRVQFNADDCPRKSILGRARAFTPLLDQPLEGPVIFRSNGGERVLPDLVLDLHGQIDLVQVGFVDSVRERLRTTFASVPDAPVTKIVLNLKGGKEGLLQNSENLCAAERRATVNLKAKNGLERNFNTTIKTPCGKRSKRAPQGPTGR